MIRERVFHEQTVFIVAGGPSLRGFDFGRLAGRRTVAINLAFRDLRAADVLWWTDAYFWHMHSAALLAHGATWKATGDVQYDRGVPPAPVEKYRFTGMTGFDADIRCLRHGNNSGYAAMHLAVHLGASRLVLLGFDMRHGACGLTHYHGGHLQDGKPLLHQESDLQDLMMPNFQTLAGPLRDRGVSVFNASPDSALTVWPRCTINEGLAIGISQNPERA